MTCESILAKDSRMAISICAYTEPPANADKPEDTQDKCRRWDENEKPRTKTSNTRPTASRSLDCLLRILLRRQHSPKFSSKLAVAFGIIIQKQQLVTGRSNEPAR